MTTTKKIALAAVLVSAVAAPAMATDWQYHGGPKSPDSLSGPWYGDDDYGPSAQAYPEGAYGYYGEPDRGRWYGPRDRYEPATSDYDNRSRMLQGTR